MIGDGVAGVAELTRLKAARSGKLVLDRQANKLCPTFTAPDARAERWFSAQTYGA